MHKSSAQSQLIWMNESLTEGPGPEVWLVYSAVILLYNGLAKSPPDKAE